MTRLPYYCQVLLWDTIHNRALLDFFLEPLGMKLPSANRLMIEGSEGLRGIKLTKSDLFAGAP